jgi:hypothetical protein
MQVGREAISQRYEAQGSIVGVDDKNRSIVRHIARASGFRGLMWQDTIENMKGQSRRPCSRRREAEEE